MASIASSTTIATSITTGKGLFLDQPYGTVIQDMNSLSTICEQRGFKYIVVRDQVYGSRRIVDDYFDSLMQMQKSVEKLDKITIDSQSLLRYFLRVHQQVKNGWGKPGNLDRDYRLTDVILVEITTHLSHSSEYSLLMYKYLMYQTLWMSQLFVVINYKTDQFDFIHRDILVPLSSSLPSPVPLSGSRGNEASVIQLESYKLNVEGLKELLSINKFVCVIISQNRFYENILKEKLSDLLITPSVHEDLESFERTPQRVNGSSIILISTPEELLARFTSTPVPSSTSASPSAILIPSSIFRPDLIVYDTRFKVEVNSFYAGNILMPVRPNRDYVQSVVHKFMERSPRVRIYDEGKEPVVRGIFERSPINDFIQFEMFGVNMILLYTNYYEGLGMKSFLSVVRSEADILRTLGYEEKKEVFARAVHLGVHPIVVSMIDKWFERKLPRIAILVFVAVMLTFDKRVIEMKDHGNREHENDVKQTSRYGYIMNDYLTLVNKHQSLVMEEGGKTAKYLKRLLDTYNLNEDEMLIFDLESFNNKLTEMLLSDYSSFTLKQKSHSLYRGEFNTQMNWWITQTTNMPQRLFPFIVSMGKTGRLISLYIPLDPQ